MGGGDVGWGGGVSGMGNGGLGGVCVHSDSIASFTAPHFQIDPRASCPDKSFVCQNTNTFQAEGH